NQSVARLPGPAHVCERLVDVALRAECRTLAYEVAAVDARVGQAGVLHGHRIEHLHHLPEIDVPDEAHIVQLDRLPPCADQRVPNAGVVDEELVHVGDI